MSTYLIREVVSDKWFFSIHEVMKDMKNVIKKIVSPIKRDKLLKTSVWEYLMLIKLKTITFTQRKKNFWNELKKIVLLQQLASERFSHM